MDYSPEKPPISSQNPQRRLPERTQALTESERRLERLCRNTFLTLWSFPGVCKDQGAGGDKSGSKEVCDLLVVFGSDVIIFSDKTCEFPATGDLEVDWSRWYKRAIVKSARQLRGAERWIRTYPSRLFLDRECKHPFPFELPSPPQLRVHRVVVAGGATERCREELGGSGSLMVSFGPAGEASTPPPFTIGHIDAEPGFIHVFDDVTIRIVLQTLDTISDFVSYLVAKEELAASGTLLLASGEEDLLAQYVKNIGPSGAHAFGFPKSAECIVLEEGAWERVKSNPQWIAKREADRISYSWDALIEKFSHYAATGESDFDGYTEVSDFEKGVRFLARESRFRRRVLANGLLSAMERPGPGQERMTRVIIPASAGDPYYVFLALHRPENIPLDRYRATRRAMLVTLCMATRMRWPEALDVVGLATEPIASGDRSEDLAYFDGRSWSAEAATETQEGCEYYGLFQSLKMHQAHADEYPIGPNGVKQPIRNRGLRVGRNDRCPCGSARKFKKCCGKT